MGRSSTGQAMQNRAKIVDCASRLFRERGIEAVGDVGHGVHEAVLL